MIIDQLLVSYNRDPKENYELVGRMVCNFSDRSALDCLGRAYAVLLRQHRSIGELLRKTERMEYGD
jgi:hypothetical protein